MTAKEYLGQIRRLDLEIDSMIRYKETLRDRLYSVSGMSFDAPPVMHSKSGDAPFEALIAKVAREERKIVRRIDYLVSLRGTIANEVSQIKNDTYRLILIMRYLEYCRWDQIADRLGYAERHIYRLHGQALEAFRKQFPERCQ